MGKVGKIITGIGAGLVALVLMGVGALMLLNRPLSRAEVDAAIQERLDGTVAASDGALDSVLFATYQGHDGELRRYASGADPDAAFHSASVGKTMLATVYGQLVDEGVIRFDDPIAAYLAPEALAGLFVVDGVDHAGEVTIGQLLSHTSGVADYFEGPVTSGPTMVEIITTDPDRLFAPDELLAFSREHQTPVGVPGERFAYSDTGYILLGLALEAIEGEPYADILDRRIFTPLGMDHSFLLTAYGTDVGALPVRANGVDLSDRAALSVDWAGGGVVTTTSDLITFLRAFTTAQLTSAQTLARLTSFDQSYDTGIRYGMGVMQFRFSELSPLLFAMSDAYGAVGSTGVYALYDPNGDTYYVANYGSLEFGQKAIEELVQLRMIVERLAR